LVTVLLNVGGHTARTRNSWADIVCPMSDSSAAMGSDHLLTLAQSANIVLHAIALEAWVVDQGCADVLGQYMGLDVGSCHGVDSEAADLFVGL